MMRRCSSPLSFEMLSGTSSYLITSGSRSPTGPVNVSLNIVPISFSFHFRGGVRVFILCLSSGDFYGEGDIRRKELFNAVIPLGINPSDVTIMDLDECKDGTEWSPSHILPILRRFILSLDVNLVVTFDDMGVSGHSNHTTCSLALKAARSILPSRVEVR